MKALFRPFGKLVVSLLFTVVFVATIASSHEAGEGISAGGEKGILFIAMGPSNNFVMIDIATERVMRAVAGPVNPHGITITPDGKHAYLTSRNPEKGKKSTSPGDYRVSVVAVDTGKIVATIDVGGESHHARMSPDGKRVYVTVPSVEGVPIVSPS
jgi:DNA-binding beta-propeller fold protein YncE